MESETFSTAKFHHCKTSLQLVYYSQLNVRNRGYYGFAALFLNESSFLEPVLLFCERNCKCIM